MNLKDYTTPINSYTWGPTHGTSSAADGVHMEDWNLTSAPIFTIDVGFTPNKVINSVQLLTVGGAFTGKCGVKNPDGKLLTIVIPEGLTCSLQYMSGTYLKTAAGELRAGIYGLSFFLDCQ